MIAPRPTPGARLSTLSAARRLSRRGPDCAAHMVQRACAGLWPRRCVFADRRAGTGAARRQPDRPDRSPGDYAGDLLYATLLDLGFATGTYDRRPDDGLQLSNCAITNAVRCVPPQNKPTPAEVTTCRRFLIAVLDEMPDLRAVVALGRIAHESVVRARSVESFRLTRSFMAADMRSAGPSGHQSQYSIRTIARVTTRARACSPRRCSGPFSMT